MKRSLGLVPAARRASEVAEEVVDPAVGAAEPGGSKEARDWQDRVLTLAVLLVAAGGVLATLGIVLVAAVLLVTLTG